MGSEMCIRDRSLTTQIDYNNMFFGILNKHIREHQIENNIRITEINNLFYEIENEFIETIMKVCEFDYKKARKKALRKLREYKNKGILNRYGNTYLFIDNKIFIMGENKWRDEYEWPLARTQWTNFYLHSRGNANSKKGDGWLSTTPPEDEPFDQYNYDPENPVPTKGGNFLGYKQWKPGAFNQAEIEKREDVLVYMTEPLTEPVEITGPIRMILYAKSSARDTDFTAKLVDVYPSGYVQNLCDGIIRARYRNGYMNPSPIEPGKVYRYEIDMWATSNLFKPGHRIGVEISSSNFPQYDRNTNCAGERPDCIKIAHQVIYHNRKYPSHIILPVIPR